MKEIEELGIELLQQVSVTNFSVVYKARQSILLRDVCVKLCSEGLLPNSKERFLREAKILTELKHPNIAGLYMYGMSEDRPFMVLEWLEGITLEAKIESGRLTIDEVSSIFEPLIDALTYTHQLGVVHRDIKPANVFLSAAKHVKLLDFGIARAEMNFCDESSLTRTGVLLGSPAYMSPEQCRGMVAGPASDQYSLACMLYQCITGSFVFEASSDMEFMFKHVHDEPALSKVGASARPVFLRALDKNPDNRYPSLRDFWSATTQILPSFYVEPSSKVKVKQAAMVLGIMVLSLVTLYFSSKHDPGVVESVPLTKSFTSSDLKRAGEHLHDLIYVEHKFKVARNEIKRYLSELPAPKARKGLHSSLPDEYTNFRAGFAGQFTAALVAEVRAGRTLSPLELSEGQQMSDNFQEWNAYTSSLDRAAALKETADWNLYCKRDVKLSEEQYRRALKLLDEVTFQSDTQKLRNSIGESLKFLKGD